MGTYLVQNALLSNPLRAGYLFGAECIVEEPIVHWVPIWCKGRCWATHCALDTYLVQNALLGNPLRTGYLFGAECIVEQPIAHWVPIWCRMHC